MKGRAAKWETPYGKYSGTIIHGPNLRKEGYDVIVQLEDNTIEVVNVEELTMAETYAHDVYMGRCKK